VIAEHIKSLDSNPMVCPSDEGWLSPSFTGYNNSYNYSSYEGVDYVNNLAIPTPRLWHLSPVPRLLRLYLHVGAQSSHRHWQSRRKHVVLEEYAAPTAALKEQYMLLW